ncbi:MAG: putative metal-binding motif-containing protein [Nanoarchaeota archaeon]
MKKIIISFLLFLLLIQTAAALTVYNTDEVITGQVGGTTYWASKTTAGDGAAATTRVLHKQGNQGANFWRPGQTGPESTFTISETPRGYGWATNFALTGDIPAGTWQFHLNTDSNHNENSGVAGVNVFKYCGTTNTRLFYIQGTTNVMNTASPVTQTISTSQPSYTASGCRLKFEYWLTATSVEEDTSTDLTQISTSSFTTQFPDPQGGACADNDGDTYTDISCGGQDCNDNNPSVRPGATETCNNLDDNCVNGIDEGLTQPSTCGVGACFVSITQTCTGGVYSPACTPGAPTTEICGNSIDEDCNSQLDNGCSCTPGQIQSCGISVGACEQGNQTCQDDATWGACTGGITSIPETCNGIDDDCDSQVDNGLVCNGCQENATQTCGVAIGACKQGNQTCTGGVWGACIGSIAQASEICNGLDDDCNNQTDDGTGKSTTCGVGECKNTIQQVCTNGALTPTCQPKAPAAEICNNKDDNCDGVIDEGLFKYCGFNVGECKQGLQYCINGAYGTCQGEVLPTKEICDFKDNNCDSFVDEGNVCSKKVLPPCVESWNCTEWTSCVNETKSFRLCTDSNNCKTVVYKPNTEKICKPEPILKVPIKAWDADFERNLFFATLATLSITGLAAAAFMTFWNKKQ